MDLEKVLRVTGVIQEVSNKGRVKKLGEGGETASRINPWNPLSYITLTLIFVIGSILNLFQGANPFKWV